MTIYVSTEPLYNGFRNKNSSDNFTIRFDVMEKIYTLDTTIPIHDLYDYRDSRCFQLSCTTLMSDHNYDSIKSESSVYRMIDSINIPFSWEETLYWKPSRYSKHPIIPTSRMSCNDDAIISNTINRYSKRPIIPTPRISCNHDAIISNTIDSIDGMVNRILSFARSMAKQGNKRMLVTIEKLGFLPTDSYMQVRQRQITQPRPANMIENLVKSIVRYETNGIEVPFQCWQRIFNNISEINSANLWITVCEIISDSRINYIRRCTLLIQLGETYMRMSMADEVTEFRPMPAATSAVEGLKKIIIVGKENSKGTCSVCMEEMTDVNGYNHITSMPCSHLFHTECIHQWLKSSHMCPLCRCKLPMEY